MDFVNKIFQHLDFYFLAVVFILKNIWDLKPIKLDGEKVTINEIDKIQKFALQPQVIATFLFPIFYIIWLFYGLIIFNLKFLFIILIVEFFITALVILYDGILIALEQRDDMRLSNNVSKISSYLRIVQLIILIIFIN